MPSNTNSVNFDRCCVKIEFFNRKALGRRVDVCIPSIVSTQKQIVFVRVPADPRILNIIKYL